MSRRRKSSNGASGSDPKRARTSPPFSAQTESTETTELLSILEAARLILTKATSLCAKQSRRQREATQPEPFPRYIDEARVSEITGMSQVWLQRARSEGIGPPHKKIARRIVYRVDQVHDWIESGAAADQHVSPPRRRRRGEEGDDTCGDDDGPTAPRPTPT